MIRVRKNETPPATLATKGYRDDDVRRSIHADQAGKCYLCERGMHSDIQVEHRQSKNNFPHLTDVWSNLFLACSFCNGKKLDNYDDILDPSVENIEALIRHDYDAESDKFSFTPAGDAKPAVECTIKLLNLIFNGTRPKLLTIKEEALHKDFQSVYTNFNNLLADYLQAPSSATEAKVRNELTVGSEFLGFKYWMIMSDAKLSTAFGDDIIWNKRGC